MLEAVPPPLPGTRVRILATSDLGAATVPMRNTYGESGTCAGIVTLLDRERERVPALWLDLGDLVVGNPAYPVLRERPWDEVRNLPIDVTVAGNHDFDDGLDALHAVVPTLAYPMLCANIDAGLPATALLDTAGGVVGVVGLTHPQCDRFTQAPALDPGWPEQVVEHARELRAAGADWVVALLHDGVAWWPAGDGIATRADRLESVVRPWAAAVDVIAGGHDFGAWTGELAGCPAGEPYLFAAAALVIDLGETAVVRGVVRVPPVRPPATSPAVAAIDAAAGRVVGELPEAWVTRTGADPYLPDRLAAAFRSATGADAGLALASFHGIQAPLDGAIAALGPGPVTELDVLRMFGALDYELVVAELRPGELDAAVAAHWALADPRNRAADGEWWNWCRMPAGVDAPTAAPVSVAMIEGAAGELALWLDREPELARTGVQGADALRAAL
jgi:hypothetical protein